MVKGMPRGIMKEMELKKLKKMSEFLPLKKTITQLLISVSIFSFVFAWSSLSSLTLLHNQKLHYFSSNSFHHMSIATNKNCIFLIFNGILIFLAKTSALVHPPSSSDLYDDMLQMRIGDGLQLVQAQAAETPISDKHMTLDESGPLTEDEDEDEDGEATAYEAEEMEVDREFEHSNERENQVSMSIAESDEKVRDSDENELQNCCLFDDIVDDRDQEESNGGEEVDEIEKLSNEELNQKFEDFIRRMKEEFRINQYQQQQLVLVK